MIIGSNIIFRENLPSTNTYLDGLLKSRDLQEGTTVHTNYQSEGRGQKGNKWESEDGKNLLVSVLIMPIMIEPEDQFIISMAIALGICDFLKRHLPECKIKWPNDIYVNDDKIAGILIENSILEDKIEFSIAGMGININQENFSPQLENPVSLSLVTGKKYELDQCLKQLLSNLDYRYKQLIADPDRIRENYRRNLYKLNEEQSFRDKDGNFTGQIVAVTESGRLRIQKNGEIKEYSFKEVEFNR